jgi:hypothetical protein
MSWIYFVESFWKPSEPQTRTCFPYIHPNHVGFSIQPFNAAYFAYSRDFSCLFSIAFVIPMFYCSFFRGAFAFMHPAFLIRGLHHLTDQCCRRYGQPPCHRPCYVNMELDLSPHGGS